MPFVSDAQRKWMYAVKPEMAARWSKETPKGAQLPGHVEKTAALRAILKTAVIAAPGPSLAPGIPGPMKIQPGTAQPAQGPAAPAAAALPQTPGANDVAPPQGQAQPPGAPAGQPAGPAPIKAAPGQPLNAADATSMARIAQMKPVSKIAAAYLGLMQIAIKSVL